MKEEHAAITVQVQPNASQNKITRFEQGVWYLKIAAPPIKGRANQELLKFLSETLGVSKSSLTIEKGMTTKRKLIAIRGLGQNQVTRQLEPQIRS